MTDAAATSQGTTETDSASLPRSPWSGAPRLRVALMGTRGVPARYGGFETFYENLAPRLAARGHRVTVYGRPHATGLRGVTWRDGVRLVQLPSVATKHLDTITHSTMSVLHGLRERYDITYFCGVGNTPLVWIPRLVGATSILNIDGADYRRDKWGAIASRYLRTVERFAARMANVVVADNAAVQERFRREHGIETVFVPYGAAMVRDDGREHLASYGVEPRQYLLWVGRTEPETRAEELINAFKLLDRPGLKLVIVGDAPYAAEYVAQLRAMADERVVFTGYQFGEGYRQFSTHAVAYIQTSPTSGTSPALLEQMAVGNVVIARGTDTNIEVVGEAGLTYPSDDPVEGLARCLLRVLDEPGLAERLRAAAVRRVETTYSWDRIADRYEEMFLVLRGLRRGPTAT